MSAPLTHSQHASQTQHGPASGHLGCMGIVDQSKPRRLEQDFHEPPWLTLIYERGGKVQEKHKEKD